MTNSGESNENDFLEDLSGLSDDLKHPNKTQTIDNIDIDNLIEDDESSDQKQLVPVEQQTKEVAPVTPPSPSIKPESSKEDIQNYVLSQCQDIIQQGKATLEQLQDTVVNTCDGKAINGYATLLASLGKVLDTANAIGMEKSRIESAINMENLKHQHKTQIKSSEAPVTKNTVNIVAGREEVMKMLEDMKDEAEEIEVSD